MNNSINNECKKNAKQARILVVDDEESISTLVKDFLSTQGFFVDTCKSGSETLRYLENNPVDLILLDVLMPVMDGIEVACKIRSDTNNRKCFIPIIMISAMDSEQDKVKGLQYADDYVTKPFSYEELLARIKVHLRIGQLQNELLISTSRYEHLYENIPEICLSLDKCFKISDCNSMFCKYLKMEKAHVLGNDVLYFFDVKEHGVLKSLLKKLEPQKILDHEHYFQLNCKDDSQNSVYVSIRAVCLGENQAGLYIIMAMKDITANMQLEQQQKIARQQLYRSARLASIGTLASGTAHEMNNPLAAILGFSDALLHRFEDGERVDDAELKQYLGIIKSEALRCRDVVENLSKFSRDYESRTEKVSLYDCLHSSVQLLNARARKKNISIINNVSTDIIVNTDAQKLGQVLVNILSNSIDFCHEGSTVTISVDKPRELNATVRLKITDTGPGIPEEILPKIFDPFFTTKEVGKGIGLGMSISYILMEECGGAIDVSSKLHEGTTVTLLIPRD